jgi:NitT/TauT family transport system ATP-binding protein
MSIAEKFTPEDADPAQPRRAHDAAGQSGMELRGVSKGYGEEWDFDQVLHDLTLTVEAGKLTTVIGPSGCGKSTLVNLVAGFETPDAGKVTIDGRAVTGPGKDRMVVFQETALMPWQTTYQNIVFGPKLRGDMSARERRAEAERLLEIVGLTDFRDKYPLQLSGGMQRRAELARALINNPSVMILDEPFRGLDAMSRELMQEFFLKIFESDRKTQLFITSEVDEAIFMADRLVILSNKPTRVRRVINIDLPRPRHYKMMSSSEAYGYRREAMQILHEEALKGFADGAAGASGFMEAYVKAGQ